LTGENKKLIEDLFLAAAELPREERSAYLESACPSVDIALEVCSLLAHDDGAAKLFDHTVQSAAASLMFASDPLIGTHLGPYRIVHELGKGGMGTVYFAIRDDQTFDKKVAVKVVKRGMDSDAVLDRFRHERRILANLSHPNICHLLDAGTTPDGRPYFIMEYVEGRPVVAYCAAYKLGITAILELFRKICDAVACAHRNLIVHRDLKASNILVAADGSPKLLDFGIAKLLDPQNRTEDTAPASRMLTLDCASPEQIRGETVSTSTDIYSLGILLFELLTGRAPWTFHSSTEAELTICNTPPPKPSTKLREAGASAEWRALAGDLDNIVLMALRKDPARRYRSVDEFSEDIRRYQAGLPVIAREDSFTYRSAKFLRRHGVAVAFASLAVLGLLFGIVYANIERRRAEVRLNQMLGLANQTLLDLHTQIERQPGSTETRLRLTQSTLTYLAGLAKEAGNNQEVRTTLAMAYVATGDVQGYPDDPNLGDSAGALTSYQAAEKLFSPRDHAPLARLYWHRGVVLFKTGHITEGVAALRKGIAESGESDTRESMIVKAGAYHSLAYAITPSNPEEALASSRRESEIFTALIQRDPNDAEAMNGLADSYASTGGALLRRNRIEEALGLFRKELATMEQLAASHPVDVMIRRDLMNSYLRVGDTLGNPARRNLGDRKGALPFYRKSRDIAEAQTAADPSNRLARFDLLENLWRIGAVMDSPEDASASLAILDSARDLAAALQNGKEVNLGQFRTVATIEEFRGWRLKALKRFPEASAAFQLSVEMAQSIVKKDATDPNPWTLILMSRSGLCPTLAAMGQREEAFRCGRQTLEDAARLSANGPDRFSMSVFVPRAQMWMGTLYETFARTDTTPQRRQEDWTAAAQNYSRAAGYWQELQARPDFHRYQAEIGDCTKKAAESNHRANSHV